TAPPIACHRCYRREAKRARAEERRRGAAVTYHLSGIVASRLLRLPGSMRQQTIRRPVTLEGVGLHSGKPARVTLSPAPEDTGIVFRAGADRIAAVPQSVVNSHYATTIGRNGTRVQTVEHLMAAARSEEHTSELQSRGHLVCRLLLEKKNKNTKDTH